MLSCSDSGAYLEAVDGNKVPTNCGYEFADGRVRETLKALQAVKEIDSMRFQWQGHASGASVAENEHLLALAARSGRLVDENLTPLVLHTELSDLRLSLEENENRILAKIKAYVPEEVEEFTILSESHILAGENIFMISPLGPRFQDAMLFNTTLVSSEIELFLTLLYSTLDNVRLSYRKFKQVEGEPIRTIPSVIFETVDNDCNLTLRVSSHLPGFEAQFLDQYDVIRTASVNPLEKTVTVREVVHQEPTYCIQMIISALQNLSRRNESGFYYQDDESVFVIDGEIADSFLGEALPVLLTEYACFGAEQLKRFKLRTNKPKLKISSLSSGIDFLDTEAVLEIDDQQISLREALKQFNKQSYIPLNDGSKAVVNVDYIRRLERIFNTRKKGLTVSFFDLPMLEELIEENDARKLNSLQSASRIFKSLTDKKTMRLPKMNATLRPYQKDGYIWLRNLHESGLGGCLADDMGLGKTIQTLGLLQATRSGKKQTSLIVMPKSLLFNWQHEAETFTPGLSTEIYHSTGRDLEKSLQADLILTTYGTLRSDVETLSKIQFDYVILDESQNIKNPKSQVTKAVLLLQSHHRLALSGTPMENNLTELYSLFHFLNPAMFESESSFMRNYAQPIQKENDKGAMLELQKKISPFILRRTKQEVLNDLPDKVEQILYVDMNEDQALHYESRRRFYQEMIQNNISQSGIKNCQFLLLQAFTELRQLASSPEARTDGLIQSAKRELVIEELTDAVANGHKALIFANFIGALESLSEDLNTAGINYQMMTGATRDRKTLVKRFQNDPDLQVFMMTLKTGGVGLNLTAADYVFIYDPWWNKAAEQQAVDRTHRIGQKNTVFTYKLVARNTIEEKILKLQERKGEMVDSIIGGDSASLKSLTVDDVRFALGEDS